MPSTPDENKGHHYKPVDIGALPEIPRAYMTGLRTFIDKRAKGTDDADIMGSQITRDDDDDWPLRREKHIPEDRAMSV